MVSNYNFKFSLSHAQILFSTRGASFRSSWKCPRFPICGLRQNSSTEPSTVVGYHTRDMEEYLACLFNQGWRCYKFTCSSSELPKDLLKVSIAFPAPKTPPRYAMPSVQRFLISFGSEVYPQVDCDKTATVFTEELPHST